MPENMAQKIIRIGSSVGVTIPKYILEEMNLNVGDHVRMEALPERQRITIETVPPKHDEVDPKLIAWTDTFIKRNRTLLDRLSKK
ncbi:hypothetical protein HY968_00195 [Candidatus Kaiserbacteria bacterium]|nr:hypothetical protein [Candidatus Kaiserbacteria bacterium]